jgi:nickel transport protein
VRGTEGIRVRRLAAALALLAALLLAGGARGHEVLHEVRPGGAVAVRFTHAGGEPVAHARGEVYSPSDAGAPHQEGRTDRAGWLAFVPDQPGSWRVKVVDSTGHGLEVEVEVGSDGAASARSGAPGGAAAWLRPLVGLAAVSAVFVALAAVRRRRGSPR